MKLHIRKPRRGSLSRRTSGMSLIEVMIATAILLAVVGPLMYSLNDLQRKSRVENSKLDMMQETREFMDQVVRDLHQAGSPTVQQFADGVTNATSGSGTNCTVTGSVYSGSNIPGGNCSIVAVGLVRFTATDLWFEGDVDGDGAVNVVRYTLYGKSGNTVESGDTCPCNLKRSQARKSVDSSGASVSAQFDDASKQLGANNYNIELQNVNNTDIFKAYKFDGQEFSPTSNGYNNSTAPLGNIRTMKITINVSSPTAAIGNGPTPVISLSATARVGNNSWYSD